MVEHHVATALIVMTQMTPHPLHSHRLRRYTRQHALFMNLDLRYRLALNVLAFLPMRARLCVQSDADKKWREERKRIDEERLARHSRT